MKYCSNCRFRLEEWSNFCPSCGVPVAEIQPSPAQAQQINYKDSFAQIFRSNDAYQSNNPYQSARQNHYPYQRAAVKKERHITFIFVTSLIFMVFLAIIFLFWFSVIPNLQYYRHNILTIYVAEILTLIVTFFIFAALLVFFIFAAVSRNKNRNMQKRIRLSEILFIFSKTVLSLAVVYAACNIYYTITLTPYIMEIEKAVFLGQRVLFSLFCMTVVAFSIVNMIKSHFFKLELRQKSKNSDSQKADNEIKII